MIYRVFLEKDMIIEGYPLKKGFYNVTGLHFFEGGGLITSVSIDTEHGELQDLSNPELSVINSIEKVDKNGRELFTFDLVKGKEPEYLGGREFIGYIVKTASNDYAHTYFPDRPTKGMWEDIEYIGSYLMNPEILDDYRKKFWEDEEGEQLV